MHGKSVAVLVHNDVRRDARVRKEIKSLVSAGLMVDVFGVGLSDGKRELSIEGSASFDLVSLNGVSEGLGLWYFAYGVLYRAFGLTRRVLQVFRRFWLWGALGGGLFVGVVGSLLGSSLAVTLGILALVGYGLMVVGVLGWDRFEKNFQALSRKLRYRRIAYALLRKISRKRYDYIHCHDLIALLAGVEYKKENPAARLIWDAHELYEEVNYAHGAEKRYIKGLISGASAHIDRCITISESFKRIYAERYPALPQASVVMNATWPSTSLPSGSESPLRKHVGIADEQKILLFQGGFAPNRGIGVLLESAHDLPGDWTLVFMGWGKLEKQILDTAAALNNSREAGQPAIQIVPPASQEDLQEWTSGATLGVIPYENTSMNHLYCTPNKLWEYPNAGVPILATDLIEMGKMIRAWDIGTLLPRDFSASDVLSALENIKEEDLSRWRKNCEKFSSEMSWSKFEPALLEAYR